MCAAGTHAGLGVVCVAKPHTLLLMLLLSNKVGNELPTLQALDHNCEVAFKTIVKI